LTERVLFFTLAKSNQLPWKEQDGENKMELSSDKKPPYKIENPDTIKTDILDPMEYKQKREIDITIKQPEYTSVCPITGLPDVGCITIKYRPYNNIIELKSLKYYLLQYRNVGIFYEYAVSKILDDLVLALKPRQMEVIGDFTARGGITTTVSAVYKKDENS
jgi:7-cyano-7-deazaguanine reductase